jgi:hypothetical protein
MNADCGIALSQVKDRQCDQPRMGSDCRGDKSQINSGRGTRIGMPNAGETFSRQEILQKIAKPTKIFLNRS